MRLGHFLGAIFLVAGTSIGAGMLALPVTTSLAGFFPTLFTLFFSWLYLTTTAFILLEVNLAFEGKVNLTSLAEKTLGNLGKFLCWSAYLLLLYCLTAAYLAGSAPFFSFLFSYFVSTPLSSELVSSGFLLLFGTCVYLGTRFVDLLNRFFLLGLLLSYFFLIFFLPYQVHKDLLFHTDYKALFIGVPVMITSFGFHIVIPSLTQYLHRNKKKLRLALFLGSLIPLCVYFIWEFLVLGVVPLQGENGLLQAYHKAEPATVYIAKTVKSSSVQLAAPFFSFFAIVTSFLGVTLSLFDFLLDGLKLTKTRANRIRVWCFTFIPPLFFVLFYQKAFLSALQYAAIFVVILLAILPALMAWNLPSPFFQKKRGKILLSLVILISFSIIFFDFLQKFL